MNTRRAATAVAIAVVIALATMHGTGAGRQTGELAATPTAPAKVRVLVNDNYFEPRSTDVREDGLVVWKWHGMNKHSIRFTKVPEGAGRKGASIRDEGRWKRRFHRPGVYRYVCKVWAGMRGSITVRPNPEPSPEP